MLRQFQCHYRKKLDRDWIPTGSRVINSLTKLRRKRLTRRESHHERVFQLVSASENEPSSNHWKSLQGTVIPGDSRGTSKISKSSKKSVSDALTTNQLSRTLRGKKIPNLPRIATTISLRLVSRATKPCISVKMLENCSPNRNRRKPELDSNISKEVEEKQP